MKKLVCFFVILLTIILCKIPVFASVDHNICEVDGVVEQSWVNSVNEQLALLPDNVIEAFQDDGFHIYISDKDLDSYYLNSQYGSVKGMTTYEEYLIRIETRKSAIETATIHEFGHWLDNHYGELGKLVFHTDSKEFNDIYNAESSSFCNTFTIDFLYSKTEFFAEGFWKYITEPEILYNTCPQLYENIDKLVSDL